MVERFSKELCNSRKNFIKIYIASQPLAAPATIFCPTTTNAFQLASKKNRPKFNYDTIKAQFMQY